MLSKNNVEKHIKGLKDITFCTNTVKERIDGFDYSLFSTIYDIHEHGKTFDAKQWMDIYAKNKDKMEVVYALIKSPYLPDILLTTISRDIPYYFKDTDERLQIPFLYETMINNKKVSDSCFKHIAENTNIFFFKNLFWDTDYVGRPKKETLVPQENIKKIANYMIQLGIDEYISQLNEDDPVYTIYDNSVSYNSLMHIKDKDFLLKTVEMEYKGQPLPLPAATNLISNLYLDETNPFDKEIIEKAFDLADHAQIAKIHDCLAENLSRIMHETMVNKCIDKTTGQFIYIPDFYKIKNMLCRLAEERKLDSAVERDLAYHLSKMKLTSSDPLVTVIFTKTDDPEIIKLIDLLLRDNKIDAYIQNPNIPKDMLSKKVNEYCNKMKIKPNGKIPEVSDKWRFYLSVFARRIEFDEEDYKTLIKKPAYTNKLILAIISSEKTPISIIDYYYNTTKSLIAQPEDRYGDASITALLCQIAKRFRQENMDLKPMHLLGNIITSNMIYNGNKDRTTHHKDAYFEREFIMDLVRDNKEDINKIKQILTDYKNTENISSVEQNTLELLLEYIKETEDLIAQSEPEQNVSERIDAFNSYSYTAGQLNNLIAGNAISFYYDSIDILKEMEELYNEAEKIYPKIFDNRFSFNSKEER